MLLSNGVFIVLDSCISLGLARIQLSSLTGGIYYHDLYYVIAHRTR